MPDTVTLKQITCANCGGDIRFDPATQVSICNFCGSKFQISQAKDVQAENTDYIFPFKVTKEQFEDAAHAWLSQGKYTPDDVLAEVLFDKISGIYVPVFVYSGAYIANWSGLGIISGTFELAGVAHSAELKDPKFADFLEGKMGVMEKYDDRYTQGFGLIPFDKTVEETYHDRVLPKVSARIQNQVDSYAASEQLTNREWNCTPEYKSYTCYKPFWWITYQYKGQNFSLYVDGLSAENIYGERPVDENRKKKLSRAYLPAIISTILFFVCLFLVPYLKDSQIFLVFTALVFPLAIAAWIYGFIAKRVRLGASKHRRKKNLKEYNASHQGIQSASTTEQKGL